MKISSIGQNNSYISGHSGNQLPGKPSARHGSESLKTDEQRSIDLTNISRGEVNQLIKSGFDDLLFMNPMKSVFDKDGNFSQGDGFSSDERFNLIGQLEGMIDYKKSIGQTTADLEKALDKYLHIHGQKFPEKLDVRA